MCNRNFFAVDVDVLTDASLAHRVQALAFEHLGHTDFIRVGRAPKRLLVYRQCLFYRPETRTFEAAVRSVSFKGETGNGDGLEILSGGRQFTAYGIHADTGQTYQWVGECNPLDDTPSGAPLVTQEQVDTFIASVREIMPLVAPSGTGKANDTTRVVDAQGKVIDGRESLLRDCVWKAAVDLKAAATPLTADAVASLGWQIFCEQASLDDSKYSFDSAKDKARVLVRRINDGRVKLPDHLQSVTVTYPGNETRTSQQARERLAIGFDAFLHRAAEWSAADEGILPPVHAIRVTTGVGKTRIAARTIAENRLVNVFFAVPTHRLGDDIAEQFAAQGLMPRVYRGRAAKNPSTPTEQMCANLAQVKLAIEAGVPVATGCCRHKPKGRAERRCKFYDTCAYQRQLRGPQPDVWIGAHELLFHTPPFGKINTVFVDESFWQDGIRQPRDIALAEIERPLIPPREKEVEGAELEDLRKILAKALSQQEADGGVRRSTLQGIGGDMCTDAISLEWKLAERPKIWPGMSAAAMKSAAKDISSVRRAKQMSGIWGAVRESLESDIAVSGRITLATNKDGERVVKTRGTVPVREHWQAPTMVMDATLPDLSILQTYYPQAEVVADIAADMPHVRIRQVLKSPTAARRLISTRSDINRKALRRYILQRWLETDRLTMLVIAQQAYEQWLAASGMPEGIRIEHFNNIAGLDRHKDVRSLILIGRTIPRPEAVEGFAAALTGVEPTKARVQPNGTSWYDRVTRGIRRPDGTGTAVECDQHPDPTAEAVRWQICEAELVQALGRGRGVNRTAATPLDIDILADVCLPLTVHEVCQWEAPPEVVEMMAEGIALTSLVDMAKAWPAIWPNERAARRTLESLQGLCPDVQPEAPNRRTNSLIRVYQGLCPDVRSSEYQLAGPKLHRRERPCPRLRGWRASWAPQQARRRA